MSPRLTALQQRAVQMSAEPGGALIWERTTDGYVAWATALSLVARGTHQVAYVGDPRTQANTARLVPVPAPERKEQP